LDVYSTVLGKYVARATGMTVNDDKPFAANEIG
jgi:hypothetical protein